MLVLLTPCFLGRKSLSVVVNYITLTDNWLVSNHIKIISLLVDAEIQVLFREGKSKKCFSKEK